MKGTVRNQIAKCNNGQFYISESGAGGLLLWTLKDMPSHPIVSSLPLAVENNENQCQILYGTPPYPPHQLKDN